MKDLIVCYSIDLVLNGCAEVIVWLHNIIVLQSIETNFDCSLPVLAGLLNFILWQEMYNKCCV